jgi:hypothetical protein
MKTGTPEICTGTYFPLRGRPQRGYYVVVDNIVVAGPFGRKYEAEARLNGISSRSTNLPLSQTVSTKKPGNAYSRSIQTVLREQEKALTSAMGADS